MNKHRRCRSDGGNVSDMGIRGHHVMSKNPGWQLSRKSGGGVSAKELSAGQAGGVRRGSATASHLGNGQADCVRKGHNAKSISMGYPEGVRRLAKGGPAKSMKAMYHELHSNFENDPPMRRLKATKKDLYEAEPHRYKRASGGGLWIQDAINPSKKGALHKALHVPKGKKIPMSKIEKAEHSKSPLLRKRANLASTLRKFHP